MSSIDRPILLKFMTMADVGIYAVAVRIATGVKFIIVNAFALGWSPMIMEIRKQPNNRELFAKLFSYYLVVAGAIVLGVSILSEDILKILVAPEYMSAYKVIPLLCLAHFFYGMYSNLEVGIFITKKSKYYIPIMGVSSLAYVLLNFLLIPKLGFIGAGWASALSYFIIPLATFFISRRLYYIPYEYTQIFRVGLAMVITYGIGLLVPEQLFPLSILQNLGIICCFPVLLLVSGFFKKEHILLIKNENLEEKNGIITHLIIGKIK